MKAKKNKGKMIVTPMSGQDLDNMRLVLRLKIQQHPELQVMLVQTGDELIVEDCSRRRSTSGKFWGAALINNEWVGQNWLGKLWMEIRAELQTPVQNLKPGWKGRCRSVENGGAVDRRNDGNIKGSDFGRPVTVTAIPASLRFDYGNFLLREPVVRIRLRRRARLLG